MDKTNKDQALGNLYLSRKNRYFKGKKDYGLEVVLMYEENLYPTKGFVEILENNHFLHFGDKI